MRLVVGLGNPGPRYRSTRHNVGFAVIVELSRRHGVQGRLRGPAVVGTGSIGGEEVVLAQPTTFMNVSGRAVASLRRSFEVRDLSQMLIVLDDMDLPVGALRVRERGGSGGHNGLQSVMDSVGSGAFPRLRIGIGRPPPGTDPVDYVLTRFRPDEKETIDEAIRIAADAVECWVQYGTTETMSRFNRPPGEAHG